MSNEKPIARIALSISTRPGRPAAENSTYRGAEIAMDELQADASYPFDLSWRVFDDFGDTVQTGALAQEIVADPTFIGVVGPMGSNEALANAPIFDKAGLVQVSPCASHPDLCKQGYRTFFRLVANEDVQGRELARMAHDYLNAKRLAVVQADDAWATTVSDIMIRAYQELGGEVVERQTCASRVLEDPTALIQAVVASEPDAVFFAVHPLEGPPISSGLREAGLTVPFLGTDAMKTTFPLGGGEPGADVYHTHTGADFRQLPSAAAFRKEYTARHEPDSTYSPEAYDAIMIIAEALKRAGVADRARVLAEVQSMGEHAGVSGPVRFDKAGERVGAPASFYKVRQTEDGLDMGYLGITSELLPKGEE
jgi:branched-chain amino acid transport system substrate-binding protein